jgi:hypothetical protein
MNFQLVTPDYMGVDNAAVIGMDYSGLPANVYIVEWKEDHGEIEYNDREPGLRENFIDIIPYAPYFQDFLSKLASPTLAQAKKMQIDIISLIYVSKRQLPFHYVVSAGSYDWDATDGETAAMSLQVIPKFYDVLGSLISQINANDQNIISQANGMRSGVNSLITIVNLNHTAGDDSVAHINNVVLGAWSFGGSDNTINQKLRTGSDGFAAPGLSTDIGHITVSYSNYTGSIAALTNPTAVALPSGWTSGTGITWTPIGEEDPVDLSVLEMMGILSGIAARQQDALAVKTQKISEVNALATVAEVIAYDVTDGW